MGTQRTVVIVLLALTMQLAIEELAFFFDPAWLERGITVITPHPGLIGAKRLTKARQLSFVEGSFRLDVTCMPVVARTLDELSVAKGALVGQRSADTEVPRALDETAKRAKTAAGNIALKVPNRCHAATHCNAEHGAVREVALAGPVLVVAENALAGNRAIAVVLPTHSVTRADKLAFELHPGLARLARTLEVQLAFAGHHRALEAQSFRPRRTPPRPPLWAPCPARL
mmetsp:Transcript_8523/g.25306  ORF Transcript_8523/g.25306 Transcript_8523/m.25306 type:complete len:228 (+) Transcript_8523:227-910(+)